MPRRELKCLFCERFACAPAEFEERAFRRCLPWHATVLAPVIRWVNSEFFAEDFKFILYLGSATGWREAQSEVLGFQDTNRAKGGLLRTRLRIRVSGRKAASLAEELFSEAYRRSDLGK
jgi:hypothetical protein